MTWAIKIEGHQHDLEDWKDFLPTPFDPSVEVVDLPDGSGGTIKSYLLRSSQFVHCKASNEVRDTAIPLVRILNALMAVHNQTKTVEFSIVAEQQSDGNFKRHFYMKAEAGEYRIRGSAVGLSIGGAARQPKKTFVQDALGLASGNLLEALEHFSRADNWHDLYKAFEAITAH